MALHRYEPVDSEAREIRLLRIVPRAGEGSSSNGAEDIIYCTLEHVVLSKNLVYDALSYSWGPWGTNVYSISISDRIMHITPNLYAVLHQLRDDGYSSPIWVDAVCINQKDSDEKGSQLPMMRQIYEGATSVIVWLGLAADDSDLVMDALSEVGKTAFEAGVLNIDPAMRQVFFDPDPDELRAAIETPVRELSDEVGFEFPFTARGVFTERGYWRRVWIVQEIVLAKKLSIHCGSKKISYDSLAAGNLFIDIHSILLVKSIQSLTPMDFLHPETGAALLEKVMTFVKSGPNPALAHLVGVRKKYQGNMGPSDTLFDLLTRGCIVGSGVGHREATDPKDMIYGLMGLAADADDINPHFDYSETTTPAQVYASVSRLIIQHGHTDILTWCQPTKVLPNLPSWVPDISTLIREPCGDNKQAGLFHASGTTSIDCLAQDPLNPTQLSLRGIRVDRIKSLGPHWKADLEVAFDMNSAGELFAAVEAFCAQSQAHEVPMPAEAIWRIPCADQKHDPRGSRIRATPSELAEGYEDVKKRVASGGLQTELGGAYQRAMGYLHNRRPAILEKGYVGLVPALSEPGDLVCIILGAHVPFVLRERVDSASELIGEAFVFGIMDGEVIQTKYSTEMFNLC